MQISTQRDRTGRIYFIEKIETGLFQAIITLNAVNSVIAAASVCIISNIATAIIVALPITLFKAVERSMAVACDDTVCFRPRQQSF